MERLEHFSAGVALRRNWWLLVVSAIVCSVAAYAYSHSQTKEYESTVQLFVSTQQRTASDASSIYEGGLFTTDRVQSYVELVSSPVVTKPVVQQLQLPYTPSELGDKIDATAPANTVLIDVTVRDTGAHRAQLIARGIARSFIAAVDRFEKPGDGGTSPVRLSVSRPASYDDVPVAPHTRLITAVAFILGLLLGMVGAVMKARHDTRFIGLDDLTEFEFPVLGVVPTDRSVSAVQGTNLADYDKARAEALRQLRTSLRYVDPDSPPKAIVVASAVQGEGKSTTSLGLASALAESGASVILLEGDLRRPSLGRAIGNKGSGVGLSGVLVGLANPADALQEVSNNGEHGGGLRVMLAGPIPPNPGQLIGSRKMSSVIAELAADCDYLIIDAPALLPVSDARVLATLADGVLLVCRAGVSRHTEVVEAMELLASVRARVLGFVANGVKRRRSTYEYESAPETRSRGKKRSEPAGELAPVGSQAQAAPNDATWDG